MTAEQAAETTTRSPYQLKLSPYSSHTLLLAALPAQGNGRWVLDVGCGDGYLSALLVERGYKVVGVDKPSAHHRDFPSLVEFIGTDLDRGLPPLDTVFSYVICADVIEHLREPVAFLYQLRRLLADDGRLVASLPNSGNLYFRLNVLFGRFPAHDRGLFDRTHLHFLVWSSWKDLFSQVGYRMESAVPTPIPFSAAWPRWKDSLPVRVLEWSAFQAARLWKTMFAYQFVVVACKEPHE